MAKTTLLMFVPTKAEHAGRPGAATTSIQLQALRPGHLEDGSDANPGVFADANGNANLSLNNLSAVETAKFSTGKKYKVTVEEITEVQS